MELMNILRSGLRYCGLQRTPHRAVPRVELALSARCILSVGARLHIMVISMNFTQCPATSDASGIRFDTGNMSYTLAYG